MTKFKKIKRILAIALSAAMLLPNIVFGDVGAYDFTTEDYSFSIGGTTYNGVSITGINPTKNGTMTIPAQIGTKTVYKLDERFITKNDNRITQVIIEAMPYEIKHDAFFEAKTITQFSSAHPEVISVSSDGSALYWHVATDGVLIDYASATSLKKNFTLPSTVTTVCSIDNCEFTNLNLASATQLSYNCLAGTDVAGTLTINANAGTSRDGVMKDLMLKGVSAAQFALSGTGYLSTDGKAIWDDTGRLIKLSKGFAENAAYFSKFSSIDPRAFDNIEQAMKYYSIIPKELTKNVVFQFYDRKFSGINEPGVFVYEGKIAFCYNYGKDIPEKITNVSEYNATASVTNQQIRALVYAGAPTDTSGLFSSTFGFSVDDGLTYGKYNGNGGFETISKLIWQTVDAGKPGIDKLTTKGIDGSYFTPTNVAAYEAALKDIMASYNKYNYSPNFASTEIKFTKDGDIYRSAPFKIDVVDGTGAINNSYQYKLAFDTNDYGIQVTDHADGTFLSNEVITITCTTKPTGKLKVKYKEPTLYYGTAANSNEQNIFIVEPKIKTGELGTHIIGTFGISKTDITGTQELTGAKLRLFTKSGTLIEEWTSNGTPKVFTNLEDGMYVLREIQAPQKYDLAEDIEFEVKDCTVPNGKIVMKDKLTPVTFTIQKQDMNGNTLSGAQLKLEKKGTPNTLVTSWTSSATPKSFTDLADGEYILTETEAPARYDVADPISFTVTDRTVPNGTIIMKDSLTPVTFTIEKVDENGNLLAGASLKLEKKGTPNTLVTSWTSSTTPKSFTDLADGEYILTETKAPDKYDIANPITFTVTDRNVPNGKIVMKDTPTPIDFYISKTDMTGTNELSGATLRLVKNATSTTVAETIAEWQTTGTAKKFTNLADGSYTLTEIQAPARYDIAESITFEIKDHTYGDGTLVMKDALTPVTFTIEKVDEKGNLLSGATLQLSKNGGTVDKWITSESPKRFTDLADGEYVLTELEAPDKYDIADPITFTVTDRNVPNGKIVMTDTPTPVDFYISKTDMTGTNELEGAKLILVKNAAEFSEEKIIAEWTSEKEAKKFTNLEDGVYTLTEIQAPARYDIAESITFEIKDHTYGDGTLVMKDALTPVTFTIEKVDENNQPLSGAKLKLSRDGETVEEWTTDGTPKAFTDLEDGDYLLTEIKAPAKYEIAEPIAFTVTDRNVPNGKIVMQDARIPVRFFISKTDITGTKELTGAYLKLMKGNVKIAEWVSDGSAKEFVNLEDGIYTLVETQAPKGYEIAESITFEIKDYTYGDGTIVMKDELTPGKFRISKTNLTGSTELLGAKLQLTRGDTLVEEWISDGDQKEFVGLEDGDYVLTEISAPDGYEVAESIKFTVKDGTVPGGIIIMKDAPTTGLFYISKTNIAGTKELSGAVLKLTKDGKEIAKWTSTTEPKKFENLEDGEYVLTEISAPLGFQIAESIKFKVTNHTVDGGTVTMKDKTKPSSGGSGGSSPAPTNKPDILKVDPTPPQPVPDKVGPETKIPQTGDTFNPFLTLKILINNIF